MFYIRKKESVELVHVVMLALLLILCLPSGLAWVGTMIDGDMKFITTERSGTPMADDRHHAAFDSNAYLWKKGRVEGKWQIPYAFDESVQDIDQVLYNTISKAEINVVVTTIAGMNTKLRSVELVPRTTEQFYLGIGNFRYGCWSYVGDVTEYLDVQPINFGPGCYSTAIVEHEIMHALGFGHEHTRADRDQHVTIEWDNVDSRYENNFAIMTDQSNWGVDYDYRSVMHYTQYAFSRSPGLPTIVTLDASFQTTIGTAQEMSSSDILQIELLYRCDGGPRNMQEFCTPDCPCYHMEGVCQVHMDCADDLVCVEPGEDDPVVDDPAHVCMYTHVAGQTREPTGVPSFAPTPSPSGAPSRSPTDTGETWAPTGAPTEELQDLETNAPSDAPSKRPSAAPSATPTDAPSDAPTDAPVVTPAPTSAPEEEEGGMKQSTIIGISAGLGGGVLLGILFGFAFIL